MEHRFVVVVDGGQEYALPVERVREVVPWQRPRRLGEPEPWLLGVVAVRGQLLQVADLGIRVGVEPGERKLLVVFDAPGGEAALAVEAVDAVVAVEDEQLKPAPPASGEAVAGIAALGDRLLVVLDADALLGPKPPSAKPKPVQRKRAPKRKPDR